jgi:hypothetical protein
VAAKLKASHVGKQQARDAEGQPCR